MIQIIYGAKGTGKTKRILSMANGIIESASGSVVFLDDDKNYMYDLKNTIRFIDVTEFPEMTPEMFMGFIYGMVAQDFDIEHIFIDGLLRIVHYPLESLKPMFDAIGTFAGERNITVTFSVSGPNDAAPDFLKPYII